MIDAGVATTFIEGILNRSTRSSPYKPPHTWYSRPFTVGFSIAKQPPCHNITFSRLEPRIVLLNLTDKDSIAKRLLLQEKPMSTSSLFSTIGARKQSIFRLTLSHVRTGQRLSFIRPVDETILLSKLLKDDAVRFTICLAQVAI